MVCLVSQLVMFLIYSQIVAKGHPKSGQFPVLTLKSGFIKVSQISNNFKYRFDLSQFVTIKGSQLVTIKGIQISNCPN
jgi:hypothetical protein